MNKNIQLILELCRFMSPDREKIILLMSDCPDWGYVLGQLIYHRMGSAAYKTISDVGAARIPNREFMNALKNAAYCDTARSNSLKSALETVGDMLDKVDFPYALLKGSHLMNLYPPGLRTSNDIDILIRQCDISAIENILMSEGFEQGYIRQGEFCPASRLEIISARMNRGETVPFIKEVNLPFLKYLEIDLNFSLDFKAAQEDDIVEKLLNNSKKLIDCGKNGLYTLESFDFFIHLCAHLYKEAATYAWVERDRDLSLYKFADLYLLISLWFNSEESCRELARRIKQYSLERECYYSVIYTAELFGIESSYINNMLTSICPERTDYLDEVYDPTNNKIYRYKQPFKDRIFMAGRKEAFYETEYD